MDMSAVHQIKINGVEARFRVVAGETRSGLPDADRRLKVDLGQIIDLDAAASRQVRP